MKRFSATTRIAVGITCLTMSLLLAAQGLGVLPSPSDAKVKGRQELCESLAIYCSVAAQQGETAQLSEIARAVAERDNDIVSLALRQADGKILFNSGAHEREWGNADPQKSTPTHVRVPILEDERQWGTLAVVF